MEIFIYHETNDNGNKYVMNMSGFRRLYIEFSPP